MRQVVSKPRSGRAVACAAVAVVGLVGGAGAAEPGVRPDAAMLLYPDVSAELIAFVYANDIWTVAREGGVAKPLASPPETELFPRFSPDGRSIAFVGNYDGNRDLYVLPTEGGVARRITHHPAAETLCDWAPPGSGAEPKVIYYSNGQAGLQRQQQL